MTTPLSRRQRWIVLVTAFLGWMCAGIIMSISALALPDAMRSFGETDEGVIGEWIGFFICAFLLGAATGGLVFGFIGDRVGRAKGMGLAILWYSGWTGVTWFVTGPEQLLVLRFVACMGVGGMWPNGVALASEAWSNVSRPMLAGLIGTAANVGFVLLAFLATKWDLTPESWRWVLLVGAAPLVLAIVVFLFVPESPSWLEKRATAPVGPAPSTIGRVFTPPLLSVTLIGIGLGAVPLLGNWGGANWVVIWASKVGHEIGEPELKAVTQGLRSAGGALGSLLGGWIATLVGRRTSYFAISLMALATTMYTFWLLDPLDPLFQPFVFAVGFFGTVYFGWLPLYLPELFPTEVRSTGTGVTFNFGRILSAFGVLGSGAIVRHFEGDYSRVGRVTCLVFLLGMVIICFAPDTSRRKL